MGFKKPAEAVEPSFPHDAGRRLCLDEWKMASGDEKISGLMYGGLKMQLIPADSSSVATAHCRSAIFSILQMMFESVVF